jgi:colanic acid/amylovoran biosynthesis glycosyltransferase
MKENVDLFPLANIISAEEFSFSKRFVNRLYRMLSGNFGLFFYNEIRKYRPLLVHAHMGFEGARWLDLIQKTKLPLITTFYGQDVSKLAKIAKWRKRYKLLFEYGAIFLAEGNYLKKQLIDIGCPEEKIIIQHLGVDVNTYPQKQYKNNGKIIILQVSTFREKKGIEYSLKAIASIYKEFPNIEFRLIGKGDSTEVDQNMHSIAVQYGIKDIVCFLGIKPHHNLIEEYCHADIFIHPSVTAQDGDNEGGSPVSIIEASAIGLPIISTKHADIPEVVIHEETGLLAPERDVFCLSEMLRLLIIKPEKRKEMGDKGRRHIENNYNINHQISKLEDIYLKVIEQNT